MVALLQTGKSHSAFGAVGQVSALSGPDQSRKQTLGMVPYVQRNGSPEGEASTVAMDG